MIYRIGYPERYSYLDDEHDEIAKSLGALERSARSSGGGIRAQVFTTLTQLKTHTANEEELMRKYAFPAREQHAELHNFLAQSLMTILEIFDAPEIIANRLVVARHVVTTVQEEIQMDRKFVGYLNEQECAIPRNSCGVKR